MRVSRAESAGFCLGVSLALRRLDQELSARADAAGPTGRLLTLGPIIHNPLVMRSYEERGVVCLDDPAEIRPGDRVVIRAHGIPVEVERRLLQSGAGIADATCPKVKKAQLSIAGMGREGGTMLLFGEREHPEVRGLLSYASSGSLVFGDEEEFAALPLTRGKAYFLAAQTTQEREAFLRIREALFSRLGCEAPVLDTICDATRARQDEARALAGRVEAMVVVGGLNSGNTRRLAEVARAAGTPCVHVERAEDIPEDFTRDVLKRAALVGLTAGASTPDEHIDSVRAFLERL